MIEETWKETKDLRRGDKVVILNRNCTVLDNRKLDTGDYELWWTYTRKTDGLKDYGVATFLDTTAFKVW